MRSSKWNESLLSNTQQHLSNRKRRFVQPLRLVLLLLALLCPLLRVKAQTTGWGAPTFKVTGSAETAPVGTNNWTTVPSWPDPTGYGSYGRLYLGSAAPPPNYGRIPLQARIAGTIETTLTWQGSLASAPATVSLKVAAFAGGNGGGTITGNNGFESASGTFPTGGGTGADGNYLIQVPVVNGKAVFSKDVKASVVGGSFFQVLVNFNATPDTRSVRLTRVGAVGETYSLNNGNWRTTGDTTFSHGSSKFPIPDMNDPIDWNVQTFQAQVTNPNNVSIVSYTWSGNPRLGGPLPVLCKSPSPEYGLFPTGFTLPVGALGNSATASFVAAPQPFERASDEVWNPRDTEQVTCTVKFSDGAVAVG